MEEYCVWTRRMGPSCYGVKPQEKRNVEALGLTTAILFIAAVVLLFLNHKDKKWKPYLMFVGALTIVLFIWYCVYEISLVRAGKLICSGARECSGRCKH